MEKIYHICFENEKLISSDATSNNCFIVRVTSLGEPERFLFKKKISIESNNINLHGLEFNDIILDENYSIYGNYRYKFTIAGKTENGEHFAEYFIAPFPPRSTKCNNIDDGILAVIMALYLIVLTGNPDIANEIYTNICTPFSIPYNLGNYGWIEYNITCLSKIIKSSEKLKSIHIKDENDRNFLNYLLSLYEMGFNHYCNNIQEENDKIIRILREAK